MSVETFLAFVCVQLFLFLAFIWFHRDEMKQERNSLLQAFSFIVQNERDAYVSTIRYVTDFYGGLWSQSSNLLRSILEAGTPPVSSQEDDRPHGPHDHGYDGDEGDEEDELPP